MIRETSKQVYKEINADGTTSKQQGKIISYLKVHPNVTRREIAQAMGIDVSSVAGRVNELINANVLSEHPRRKCSISGRSAHPVSI